MIAFPCLKVNYYLFYLSDPIIWTFLSMLSFVVTVQQLCIRVFLNLTFSMFSSLCLLLGLPNGILGWFFSFLFAFSTIDNASTTLTVLTAVNSTPPFCYLYDLNDIDPYPSDPTAVSPLETMCVPFNVSIPAVPLSLFMSENENKQLGTLSTHPTRLNDAISSLPLSSLTPDSLIESPLVALLDGQTINRFPQVQVASNDLVANICQRTGRNSIDTVDNG